MPAKRGTRKTQSSAVDTAPQPPAEAPADVAARADVTAEAPPAQDAAEPPPARAGAGAGPEDAETEAKDAPAGDAEAGDAEDEDALPPPANRAERRALAKGKAAPAISGKVKQYGHGAPAGHTPRHWQGRRGG